MLLLQITRISLIALCLLGSICSRAQEGFELTLEEAIEMHPRKILSKHLIDTCTTFIGVPYKYGGDGPGHFDCSGFVRYVFNAISKDLPRSSGMIANTGKSVAREELEPGDLVIFTGRNKNSKVPGHVGIITEIRGNQIFFIHASTSSGVRLDSLFGHPYFEERLLEFRTWEW